MAGGDGVAGSGRSMLLALAWPVDLAWQGQRNPRLSGPAVGAVAWAARSAWLVTGSSPYGATASACRCLVARSMAVACLPQLVDGRQFGWPGCCGRLAANFYSADL